MHIPPLLLGRCADVDLARWLTGGYAIPSTDPEDIEAAIEAAEAERDETALKFLPKASGQPRTARLERPHPNAQAFPVPG